MTITERIKHLVKKSSDLEDYDEFILSKEIFRKIIDRERDRANRTGEVFSLVVFVLPDNGEKQEALALLAESLSHRVRSIDAIGWLDLQHVGILLPETNPEGAHMFARKIYQEVINNKSTLSYEIFTYPSDKLTDPQKIPLHVLSGKFDHKLNKVTVGKGGLLSKTLRSVDYMFFLSKRLLKRYFDVFGASVFLLMFSPLFLAIAALIKIVSPGPVFYKQQRVGYAGQPFTFLKFRTMRLNAETREHQDYLASLINGASDDNRSDVPMAKLDHDPQIIPCGGLLRKSCLDELPQLFNVLRGEMSLVGPRPPIPYEVKEYRTWHRGRFNALPGMTGLWQVSGKNKLSFREMVRLDIRYARERSLWVDIKILFRTPLAVFEQLRDSLKNKKSSIEEGI
jgi:lipopolysaccharide/colanic/teichoic acid biosynthesis glycosyltransferase